jgi:hypothetical protein
MAKAEWTGKIGLILGSAVKAGALSALRNLTRSSTKRTTRARTSSASRRTHAEGLEDFPGTPVMQYNPHNDGRPDPGEIIWAWVPYEEDHARGKDRPVLIIGRDGVWLLGLLLTSKDHDRDEQQEARFGRYWTDIGAGDWDAQRRPSEVRLDRVLRVDPSAVRREGSVLDRPHFDRVAREVARVHQLKRR